MSYLNDVTINDENYILHLRMISLQPLQQEMIRIIKLTIISRMHQLIFLCEIIYSTDPGQKEMLRKDEHVPTGEANYIRRASGAARHIGIRMVPEG